MLRFNLFSKVLGSFLLLSLLPLGLLLFNSEHSLREVEELLREQTSAALDEQAVGVLKKRSELVADQVSAFLQEVEGDLHDLSLISPTEDLYLKFSANHQRDLWYRRGTNEAPLEIRESLPLYSELAYVAADGQELLRIVDGMASAELRNVADPAQTTFRTENYFAKAAALPPGEIWVTRLAGWYVSRDEQLAGAENPYEAVQGRTYRGVIRFVAPLYRAGTFSGLVVLSLDHRHLLEFTQHINPLVDADVVFPSYDSGNYAFMFDDQGWMVTHPKYWDIRGYASDGILVPAYSEETSAADIRAGRMPFNLFVAGFIHANYPRVAAAVTAGASGVLDTTNIGGSQKVMAFAPIRYTSGVYRDHGIFGGITIGAEVAHFHQPAVTMAARIRELIDQYLLQSLLVILATVFVIICGAYFLANSIVRPLKLLTEGTKRMIAGTLSSQLPIESHNHDEVAVLATSFNRMVTELNGRSERLIQTLQALRRSRREIIQERNFKNTVFENIETGLLTFDRDCRVTSLNGPACTILQLGQQQEGDWRALFQDWPEMMKVLEGWFANCRNGDPGPFTIYVPLLRSARQLTFRLALFPLSFRQQEGWLLTIEDLTERVNLRQQMARMERLASLGRMSAGIAHEIRNPLTGVCLLLDELHDRLIDREADQQLIRRALGEIERLESLVNEMLRFATLPEPKLRTGQFEGVVRESLFLLRNQCLQQQVVLHEQIAEDLPQISLDADRIKQVLFNLLNNALDAMPDGGELWVELLSRPDFLLLSVRDSGIGIAEEKLPLVFEPFYTDKGQGTGLGLAISYNIVSDHGGEIHIDSQLGEGTCVTVALPL
jgi:signal transduction histidine kinase/HAMP domain-containing protein